MTETAIEHTAHPADHDAHGAAGHDTGAHQHHPDLTYVKVAGVLAVLTALETATYWVDLGSFHTPFLLIMMVTKFVLVLLFFMHLKFDNKLFGVLFYMGLGLTLMVYLAVLFSYRFFTR